MEPLQAAYARQLDDVAPDGLSRDGEGRRKPLDRYEAIRLGLTDDRRLTLADGPDGIARCH
jgi:hypothetical protein